MRLTVIKATALLVAVCGPVQVSGQQQPRSYNIDAGAADEQSPTASHPGCFGPEFAVLCVLVVLTTYVWSATICRRIHENKTRSLHRLHGETVNATCLKRWKTGGGEDPTTYHLCLKYYALKLGDSNKAYEIIKDFSSTDEQIYVQVSSCIQVSHIMAFTGDARSAVLQYTLQRPCINGISDVVGWAMPVIWTGVVLVAGYGSELANYFNTTCLVSYFIWYGIMCSVAWACNCYW